MNHPVTPTPAGMGGFNYFVAQFHIERAGLVWKALQDIPPGRTSSYSEVAERIGKPRAVRAVATACASNVLALAIPCRRVVRSNGDLSGYRWGIERKRSLIDAEATARQQESA